MSNTAKRQYGGTERQQWVALVTAPKNSLNNVNTASKATANTMAVKVDLYEMLMLYQT